ncbi:SMP-30/gluconolactonase/LRE family protein [Stappia taiwanensis]|uniref:SMP-30/gluconolactonase/LRE family protein n=1 Tax=Stappia taiwanensis TaxID=992267 RepID=A0A838XJT1_9HYPH|nr:SMP-30/gluconolactonase/LRE family protein [Stappia taiwanensis]MBA4610795.1 SMP-30/gluconolactonase/LRE family protein [Stappia taiwanensis]GGE95797.1 gluconolaconase [Stappia taiwanensis]
MIYDDRICELGEGPLWHPGRQQLFWFDILGKRLLARSGDGLQTHHEFGEYASSAGWIDDVTLLIATESGLYRLDVESGARALIVPLEPDNPLTRSNDGQADPWGGFWVGTMGKNAEPGAGALYRLYRGEVRRLFAELTIPNAICFSPDRRFAYFTDTAKAEIMRVPLAPDTGFPAGDAEILIGRSQMPGAPDGAAVDRAGNLFVAQWGAAKIAVFSPDGQLLRSLDVPAQHVSCPAFGGPDYTTLYVTSARAELSAQQIAATPQNGMTFQIAAAGQGRPAPRVLL